MTDAPATQNAVDVLKHDDRHPLSHLEAEFIQKLKEFGSFSRVEAAALLAWVAGRL